MTIVFQQSMTQVSLSSGVSHVPNIAALPLGDTTIADWINFPGPSMAVSYQGNDSPWTDTSGVVLRRIANSTNVGNQAHPSGGSDKSIGMQYASAGPLISRAFGTSLDTYWVCISNPLDAANANYVFKYQRGVGFIPGSMFTLPLAGADSLPIAFSNYSGDTAHIVYMTNKGSTTIHRYDCNAQAYASNAVFAGANASIAAGGSRPGWLQTNWSGTHLVYMYAFDAPTFVCSLDMATGTITQHAPTTHFNEPKVMKGTTKVVTFCLGGSVAPTGRSFWFVAGNHVCAPDQSGSTQTHSNSGENTHYTFNADSSSMPIQVITPGTDPGSDGGAWGGSDTSKYGGGGTDVTTDTDNHPCMSWNQTGAGTNEYFCSITNYANPGIAGGKTTPGAWSVFSGSIYQSTVSFTSYYGNSSRGVTGVIVLSGGNYVSKLIGVGSTGAMTAGTFFWNGTTLYAWMADSSDPTGKVQLRAQAKLQETMGYIKQDGTERRRLCFTYRNDSNSDTGTGTGYYRDAYGNWSPDGLLAAWNCNFGVDAGPAYLMIAEVPST
jgi:hypothetical protein